MKNSYYSIIPFQIIMIYVALGKYKKTENTTYVTIKQITSFAFSGIIQGQQQS